MITGHSGSGKSTLLNILSFNDKASEGDIFFLNQNIKKKKGDYFSYVHNKYFSFLYQEYFLIEEDTVLENIITPLIIRGEDRGYAIKKAKELLKKLNLESLQDQYVNILSGGEKQRVALIRSLITSPKIIFMDEPTGALDISNRDILMNIIKKISKSILIIFVTHDLSLVEKYADRVINLVDGELVSDKKINECGPLYIEDISSHPKIKTNVDAYLFKKNIKHNWKRNIISFIGLSFSFISLILVIGFISGAPTSLKLEYNRLLDIGVSTISKEEIKKETDTPISIVKISRPSLEEINRFMYEKEYYLVGDNYSYLLDSIECVKYDGKDINNVSFSPVYSFDEGYIDYSLFSYHQNNIQEDGVIINTQLLKMLNKEISSSSHIDISIQKDTYYRINKDEIIRDVFVFNKRFKIMGVVDEIDFMNYPKIYYSYRFMNNYLSNIYLNNLSTYLRRDYSWKERINYANNSDEITSFSKYIFLNDCGKVDLLEKDMENSSLSINNISLSIKKTALSFIEALELGISVFLILIFAGVIILLFLSSAMNYLSDKRKTAIYISLGMPYTKIENTYLYENLVMGMLSLIVAVSFSYLFSYIINQIVTAFLGFKNIINIPMFSLFNKPYLFPIILIGGMLIINLFTTLLTITHSRKHQIIEEIKNND